MANEPQKLVYVPDRRDPFRFAATMTNEEIRSSLITTGNTSVEGAQLVEEPGGLIIRFTRVQGGSKGL